MQSIQVDKIINTGQPSKATGHTQFIIEMHGESMACVIAGRVIE